MKKTILFLAILVLFRIPGHSQTVYWTEDFSFGGQWTLDNNWFISDGKLHFYWYPQLPNFDLSAISPVVQLVDNAESFIVKQHLNAYGASSPPETAEIILIANGEEHLLWSYTLNQGSWGSPAGTNVEFDIAAFAGQAVQFKFRTHGPNTYQWNAWDIHEIKLVATFENDLAAQSISGPKTVGVDESATWAVEVKNLGSLPQDGFTVALHSARFHEVVDIIDYTETIAPQQSVVINFDWTPNQVHNTVLYASLINQNDDYVGNNSSRKHFVRVKPEFDVNVLVWNKDNGINTVVCPDQGDKVRPTVVMTRVLNNAGINYQLINSLPADLSPYNIVMASLGCYCLS